MLDGTPECPQEQPHKSGMTLMSPKECEIIWCNPNQFEITPESPVLDLVQSPIPHPTRQVACLTLGTTEIPRYTSLKSRVTPGSAQELEESSMDAMSSGEESRFPGFY